MADGGDFEAARLMRPHRATREEVPRLRTPAVYTPEQMGGDFLDFVGEYAAPPPASRKRRSKAEQATNPYEFTLQCTWVKQLRLLLPADYIVQANVQERNDGVAGQRAHDAGQEPGWPDLGVYGDGRCWLIENKDAKGRRNKAQKLLHPRIHAAGIPLLEENRSLEQAVAFLRANGARFRGAISA
jgi:hypothetical protein